MAAVTSYYQTISQVISLAAISGILAAFPIELWKEMSLMHISEQISKHLMNHLQTLRFFFRGGFDQQFLGLADYALPKDMNSAAILQNPTLKLTSMQSASVQNSPLMTRNLNTYQNLGGSHPPPPPPPYIPQPLQQRHLLSNHKDIKSASATPTAFSNIRKFASLEPSSVGGSSRQLLIPNRYNH